MFGQNAILVRKERVFLLEDVCPHLVLTLVAGSN